MFNLQDNIKIGDSVRVPGSVVYSSSDEESERILSAVLQNLPLPEKLGSYIVTSKFDGQMVKDSELIGEKANGERYILRLDNNNCNKSKVET